jgi:hypothetical protein
VKKSTETKQEFPQILIADKNKRRDFKGLR